MQVLLSIKPEFAESILARSKKYEFRYETLASVLRKYDLEHVRDPDIQVAEAVCHCSVPAPLYKNAVVVMPHQ